MRIPSAFAAGVAAAVFAFALGSIPAQAAPAWAGAWGYAAADAGPQDPVFAPGAFRYRVKLTQAGDALRFTLSNAEGTTPLSVSSVSVSAPAGATGVEVAPGTARPVAFSGKTTLTLARGESIVSDPVNLAVRDMDDVVVTVTLATPSQPAGNNPGMYMAFAPATTPTMFLPILVRPFLSLVSVRTRGAPCTVVAFGDSITDGVTSLSPQSRGWPGRLAERLAQLPPTRRCGVVNMGISGNRVLQDGRAASALNRFARDVASVPGVTHIIFLEGINDIGAGATQGPDAITPERLIAGYRAFVARAHALGVKVIGGTITPALRAFYMNPQKEQTRLAVNAAIRSGTIFDAVVDFDAAVRNPAAPSELRPDFDPGDHLHPNDAALRVMGDAVDLSALGPATTRR
ncbi:SGNH/GDSL hydrolase family protein [Novosphingobium sp. Leaf2]|uniref:SGNH/GDSL hydrolase family protein n=1 Tax=Novosphingobium sp. Leaf2 TaxID=1735670 RepID=UPI0006FB0B45|nr:SGNH/GDSL hydrolase family protein [Novosphingobium sp. Leaf2]KQM20665.1 lysophospholipase [Novosphingobium sp. Leaf2]